MALLNCNIFMSLKNFVLCYIFGISHTDFEVYFWDYFWDFKMHKFQILMKTHWFGEKSKIWSFYFLNYFKQVYKLLSTWYKYFLALQRERIDILNVLMRTVVLSMCIINSFIKSSSLVCLNYCTIPAL